MHVLLSHVAQQRVCLGEGGRRVYVCVYVYICMYAYVMLCFVRQQVTLRHVKEINEYSQLTVGYIVDEDLHPCVYIVHFIHTHKRPERDLFTSSLH